jgi:stearoyl-CoA desaturase (delta-9 desaturase)
MPMKRIGDAMSVELASPKAPVAEPSARLRVRLPRPAGAAARRIYWRYAIVVAGYHLVASLAFQPTMFSWVGVVVAVIGIYAFGALGINLCYHRLLSHRSFSCPKWLEHGLAILGACSLQDAPARWVAAHRRHHHHADHPEDPHTPWVSFVWGHFGWLIYENSDLDRVSAYERYARDILRDPFYKMLERNYVGIIVASWVLFFVVSFMISLLWVNSAIEAARFGALMVLWGVFVRTVLVWHITWSVNSAGHLWGYRNFDTPEDSRNNVFVAIFTSGEGWHNNHHADPNAANFGCRWWELDGIYIVIRGLAWLGLADDIATTSNSRDAVHVP